MRDVPIRNFAALSAYRAARTARIVENLYLAGFHGVHLRVPAFRKASFLFLRQILARFRAILFKNPNSLATFGLSDQPRVAKSEPVASSPSVTTGAKPRQTTLPSIRNAREKAALAPRRRFSQQRARGAPSSPAARWRPVALARRARLCGVLASDRRRLGSVRPRSQRRLLSRLPYRW